ncbi:hypothetical protein MSUIS_04680 [Mycoplasma suis KI3806]|uniref:Uncharacterized protein n=1 Tax=Mycoplasma suis (strain KI_3806) TaxID=708248 RepID=F0V1N0_MYCS3|nr:hypothetical protein [Mycoplasma suis]CBZ40561.1 hypothetical protein MSUIS_04680 [Mycoplasma suis KI3806]
MKLLELSIFKGIPFLAFLSFPAGLYFFNSSPTKQVGELGGLTARVNLFLEGNGQVGASQSSVSSVDILGGAVQDPTMT